MMGRTYGAARVAALTLIWATACGGSDETRGAVVPDAGVSPPLSAGDALYAEGDSSTTGTVPGGMRSDIPSCFNEGTNPVITSCAETELACGPLYSCCVGDGDCCEPITGALPSRLPTDGCAHGAEAGPCLAGLGLTVQAFGMPRSWIEEGALVAGGDDHNDSGLLLGEPVDLATHRVELVASFGADSCEGAECLESVGVAFTTQQFLGDESYVRPLVGLFYSGSRDDVRLIVADEVVATWPLGEDGSSWRLLLRPTGEAEVHDGTGALREPVVTFMPAREAQLVVYGRSRNRSADAPVAARLLSLDVGVSLCDIPTAWTDRALLPVLAGTAPAQLDRAMSPSFARDAGGNPVLAFEDGGRIFVAAASSAGGELVVPASPALEHNDPAGSVGDPELVWDGARWAMYFTLREPDGTVSVARAQSDSAASAFDTPAVVVDPAAMGFARVEDPSVVVHESGTWVMAAVGTTDNGTRELVLLRSADGLAWARQANGGLGDLTRRSGGFGGTGFDADEIASPSLVVHGGTWQLYYAGRRGTRWSIGLLTSDELLGWRLVGAGEPVLGPDGEGFDRVTVFGPDAVSQEGQIDIVYVGGDGARNALGLTSRQAPLLPVHL